MTVNKNKEESEILEMDEELEEGVEEENILEVQAGIEEEKQLSKLDILKKLSPGSALRDGLNDILNGEMGALIVIGNSNSTNIFEGGFKVNCKFTPRRLSELAKMDGAIIISNDFKKILVANALLVPDRSFDTSETGTRHQSAERTAKQISGLVIAVSERRKVITAYYGNSRYVLQNTEDLLRRATETLRILEKQREVFDELLTNLNILEVTNLVSIADISTILQRVEMIRKMADIINEYIVELGKDGVIVRMRMREVTKGIEKEKDLIIRDYIEDSDKVTNFFDNLSFEGLLDSENIARLLFGEPSEARITPKGWRILSKTSLSDNEINNLITTFKNFDGIINADTEEIRGILKSFTDAFQSELVKLKEQIMVGRKI